MNVGNTHSLRVFGKVDHRKDKEQGDAELVHQPKVNQSTSRFGKGSSGLQQGIFPVVIIAVVDNTIDIQQTRNGQGNQTHTL